MRTNSKEVRNAIRNHIDGKYKYYQEWYRKWVRIFNRLLNVLDTPKAKLLREKVKHFFWKLEWRMLCYKWYGDKAEQSSFWVASLK